MLSAARSRPRREASVSSALRSLIPSTRTRARASARSSGACSEAVTLPHLHKRLEQCRRARPRRSARGRRGLTVLLVDPAALAVGAHAGGGLVARRLPGAAFRASRPDGVV